MEQRLLRRLDGLHLCEGTNQGRNSIQGLPGQRNGSCEGLREGLMCGQEESVAALIPRLGKAEAIKGLSNART